MKPILALVIILLGIVGGGAAGIMLRPVPDPEEIAKAEMEPKVDPNAQPVVGPSSDRAFVEIGPQMIIPIVEGGRTRALMLFELAIDVPTGRVEDVHAIEPRLKDAFLTEFLRMSQAGAFNENFTDNRVIGELRGSLTRAAQRLIGDDVAEVLILDIMRQEQ